MPAIRRHVHIASTPRSIWRALTTADGLESWLADDARVDARAGGRVVLGFEDDEGNPVEARGLIHKWRPVSHLEITWDRVGNSVHKGTHLALQLARDGGEVRLTLVQSGDSLDDEDLRKAIDTEWRRDLRALQSMLDTD